MNCPIHDCRGSRCSDELLHTWLDAADVVMNCPILDCRGSRCSDELPHPWLDAADEVMNCPILDCRGCRWSDEYNLVPQSKIEKRKHVCCAVRVWGCSIYIYIYISIYTHISNTRTLLAGRSYNEEFRTLVAAHKRVSRLSRWHTRRPINGPGHVALFSGLKKHK